MRALGVDDFPAYFQAVDGREPFSWQQELVERVLTGGGWPEAIDVPTGLGKTAVIDVAVFALAAEAGAGSSRTAPTRTFVVVDRRVIVDQSFERARTIARKLREPAVGTVLDRVATALRSLSDGGPPLEVCRMRGGTTWSWRWLARPSQPAVVVATVDQFGSRLLFRGYGVGRNLRPIDAALCGADSLLVLDEAHLSQPLIETALAAAAQQARSERVVIPRPATRPVLLSATLPSGSAAWRPDLDAETSRVSRRRLDARRTVHLVELATRKDAGPELAEALAALATDGLARGEVERVAVVCNTVAMAREVFGRLRAAAVEADIALLIGRCRQIERDRVVERWLPRLAAVEKRPAARTVIAVATQTVEVGADLDVDLLVTEAAPLDALLQRLGRLNRLGRALRADAVVVHAPVRHADDPVYGLATRRTWGWLVEQAGAPVPVKSGAVVEVAGRAPTIELGPQTLAGLLTPDERRALAAEPPLAPVVLGPVLDGWARTSPVPEPDQPVAPYLHGIARPSPEVQVCWRAGLPPLHTGAIEAWEEELRSAPVTSGETVSVPIWEAARFLSGAANSSPVSDLEGAPEVEIDVDLEEREPEPAVVVSPDGDVEKLGAGRPLRPGDTVVVPSESGGHDEWGWTGVGGDPVPDVADLALRRRPRLRLRPEVLGVAAEDDLRFALRALVPRLGEEPEADREQVRALLERVQARLEGRDSDRLAGLVREIRDGEPLRLGVVPPGRDVQGSQWVIAEGPPRLTSGIGGADLDEEVGDDDEVASSASSRRVSLEQHLRDVARIARRQAELLGLGSDLVAAVELAGRAHDLGKADQRFQAMLQQGDRLRALASPEPLAKSGMDPADRAGYRRARALAGWPKGMRHESISAALLAELLATSPELSADVDLDLVLHLVQSHHGRARPLLPPVADDSPRPVSGVLPGARSVAEVPSDRGLVDWEGPARFARLGRRYGWWGLALLEAIVRLADMEASESYQQGRAAR